MNKNQKQLITLITVVFVSQLLFIQFTKADTIDDLENLKGPREDSKSVIYIENSPQPILFDGDDSMDMAQRQKLIVELEKAQKDFIKIEKTDISEIKAYVLAEAEKLGLDKREVELIVKCESTWNDKAMHKNRNGSIDAGLWQINSIHKNLSFEDKMDYKKATDWALKKRIRDGNWSAWYCAKRMGIKT